MKISEITFNSPPAQNNTWAPEKWKNKAKSIQAFQIVWMARENGGFC